ncbi:MAG: HDOD domain-containing protein, partial [Phycisphaeraceae bacterium]|nr:HDOD domain-containing protein [Phycisphaeraceae bacterium]
MPVLDGMTTLAALKRNPTTASMPVILMTKYSSNQVTAKSRALGAAEVLNKSDLKLQSLKEKIAHTIGYTRKEIKNLPNTPLITDNSNQNSPSAQMGQSDPWEQAALSICACTASETRAALGQSRLHLVFEQLKEEISRIQPDQFRQCSRLIETDPAAICSVLQFINADIIEPDPKITRVRQAVESLGIPCVQKIIQNMPVRPHDPLTMPWIIHWWRHAIATSHLAAAIGPFVGIDEDSARVMGMLHDIGRLQLLNSEIAHSVIKTYDVARNVVLPMTHCEQIMLGVDHLELGAEYCETHGMPQAIGMACITHEFTDSLRNQLPPQDLARSALICTCDQIANAAGFQALPGIDLRPLPMISKEFLKDAHLAIEQALSQATADTHWWLGKAIPQLCHAKVDLTGINIVLISSFNNPWNPYRRSLILAGANVLSVANLQQASELPQVSDIVIIDQTATNLHDDVVHLNLIATHFNQTPVLLLAQRSDEPHELVEEQQWAMHVYATPIRAVSMFQAIRKLVTGPNGEQTK